MGLVVVEALYNTAEAAHCADAGLVPVREWLADRNFTPDAPRRGVLHRFSAADVLRLAVVASLVPYGIPIRKADQIFRIGVAPFLRTPATATSMVVDFDGLSLRVHRDRDAVGFNVEVTPKNGTPHGVLVDLEVLSAKVAERLLRVPA